MNRMMIFELCNINNIEVVDVGRYFKCIGLRFMADIMPMEHASEREIQISLAKDTISALTDKVSYNGIYDMTNFLAGNRYFIYAAMREYQNKDERDAIKHHNVHKIISWMNKDTCCMLDTYDFSIHRIKDRTKRRIYKMGALGLA